MNSTFRAVATRLALFAALPLSAFAVACGGDDGPKTFEVEEVSFEVPGNWKEGTVTTEASANQEWQGLVGVTDTNHIYVAKYTLNFEVDDAVIENQLDELDAEIRSLLESDGGEVEDGPEKTEVATLTALRYEGVTDEDGEEFHHIWVFIFDGDEEYFVNCTWDHDHEDEVEEACERALESFVLD